VGGYQHCREGINRIDMVNADHIAKKAQVRFDDALVSPSD